MAVASPPDIESLIRTLRGRKVLLDADLACIYGLPTKALNQAVRRNAVKFPEDFRFRLTPEEAAEVARSRSQFVTLKRSQFVPSSETQALPSRSQIATLRRGQNIKYLPYAFTEHGAIMAANVLNSPRAVQMSVFVVRAFIQMRDLLGRSRELARQLAAPEKKLTARLDVHETAIVGILQRIMALVDLPPPPPEPPRRKIGFRPDDPQPRVGAPAGKARGARAGGEA